MALSNRVVWEVRTGGSSLNGGGFDPSVSVPGTDRSQQASAAVVIDNSAITTSITANVITFTGYVPTALDLGNVVHMASGTNVTIGAYVITAQTPTTWTVAGAVNLPTSGTTTNATGKMGGALSSPNDTPAIVDGTVWIQAGAGYTIGSQWVLNAGVGDGNFVVYAGYTTVRGDNGLATVTASANLSPMLTQADNLVLRNLKIDGASNTATSGVNMGASCYVENVWVTGCNNAGMTAQNPGTRINRCRFTNNGAGAAGGRGLDAGTGVVVRACEASGNHQGFSSSNGSGDYEYCVSHGNTAAGFYQQGTAGMRLRNCVADGNAGDGLVLNDTFGITSMEITNCLFTSNGGWGIESATTDYTAATHSAVAAFFQNNGFFNNTSGNYHQVPAGAADVLLTADPYTNRAGGDYSLNGTTGGGAALLGKGLPGGFGLTGTGTLGSTGFLDIGAVQTLGAGVTPTATATMMTLWREITNERFTPGDANSAVPDATVQAYLTWACHELNRRVHYHVSDATIALIAGQQEYQVPLDYVEAQWVQYGSYRKLERSDTERWMQRGEDWRHEAPAEPAAWAVYANKLVLRPAPSAEAVAANPNLTMRYVSTPPDISSGPDQLGSQDYRSVVLWAAYLWSVAYPESLVAQQRLQALKAEFEEQANLIKLDYARRNIST